MTRLSDISVGQRAQVKTVNGDDSLSLRLMEMGLTPGSEVQFMGVAPLGDPMEVEIHGYRLSLRRAEAARVEVSVI